MSTPGHRNSSTALGAYGFGLLGLEAAAEFLVLVETDTESYRVESVVAPARHEPEYVDADRADLQLRSGGRVLVDRLERRIRFEVPRALRPDEIVHPYLAPAAAVIGRWLGRESVHAGAVAVGGRALGVVGEREAGKSSTLAWLALNGNEILCDDLLVLDGRRTFTGPRSIDLRPDAAQRFGAGEAIGITGGRERWRLQLPPGGEGHELVGFAYLAWGDTVSVRSLGAAERLARLAPQRGLRIDPARQDALLDLVAAPAWELTRPRGWASLPEAGQRLLELATTTPTAGA